MPSDPFGKTDTAWSVTSSYGTYMTLITKDSGARLEITPRRPALDTRLHVQLHGLRPGVQVTLRAEATDPRGRSWCSAAVFEIVDDDGVLDLHRHAPLSGSYRGVDPMGLIWSMRPVGGPTPGHVPDFLAPTPLRLTAETDGKRIAWTEVQRLRVPDDLVREDIREQGLVGTLYRPAGDEHVPGVILLGGAEGGMHEDDAALLAGHGYAALALAYYGMPGLPPTLRDVPLEYFATALEHMRRHPNVQADRLAAVGASKGGEAALLIGSLLGGLRAVVSVVGSGLVTQGISQDVLGGSFLEILATPVASWTYQGCELPYLPNVSTPRMEQAVAEGSPVALRWAMPEHGHAADLVSAATTPVDRIDGAVLLISGEDDQGYGVAYHDAAARRLARSDRPGNWRHIIHKDAGHLIAAPPYGPTTQSTSPGPGVTFRHGGTPAADALAREAAWRQILDFLRQELRDYAGPKTGRGRVGRAARAGLA